MAVLPPPKIVPAFDTAKYTNNGEHRGKYVPAKNPRFPKLAAALPAVLEAIDKMWAEDTADQINDAEFIKAANKVNRLAEAACKAFSEDGLCPNRFSSMKQILAPKVPFKGDIWSGFNEGVPIGGVEPGFFVKAAMMELE